MHLFVPCVRGVETIMIFGNICMMHYLKIAIGVITFLLLVSDSGAIPSEQWNKTFGVIGNDGATSVQQTSDEGYIFVGYTYRPGYSNDAWIIKTDVLGNGQKENIFGGTDLDEAKSVQQASDGGYIIAGYTQSYGAGSGDAWLIKTDASGNEQWNKTFGGSSSDRAESVQQTSDGGYIIAGNTQSYGAGSGDAWLIKTDASGKEQWDKTFGGTTDEGALSVQQISNGGYILAGWTNSYGAGSGDAWLIKTDAKGNLEWSKTFGGTKNDGVWFVQQASDRGYILAGWTYSYGAGSMDAWLIKADANGNEQWNKTFGGAGGDGIRYVRQTSDGGYILAGSSNSYNADYLVNAWLIKISPAQTEPPKTPAFETLLAIGAMLLVLLVRKGKIK